MSGRIFAERIREDKERDLLLNSLILHICIGIEPIKSNVFQGLFLKLFGIKNHYSCFVKLSALKENEGIILEYVMGKSYTNYIDYEDYSSDGIRISKMSFTDYEKKVHNGANGSQILDDFIVVNNKMTLGELLYQCNSKSEKKWGIRDYNLSSHNCKHFILKVIEVLKVSRNTSEWIVYRYKFRQLLFPPEILPALENNESEEVRMKNEIEPPFLNKLLKKFFN